MSARGSMTTYHYNGNDLFAGKLRLSLPLGVPNPVAFALLLHWFNSAAEDRAEAKALVMRERYHCQQGRGR